MYTKTLMTSMVLMLNGIFLCAQNDSLVIADFTRYSQIQMGGFFGNYQGTISEFTKYGGGFDMYYSDVRDKSYWGFNMQFFASNKEKEFTIPPGYEHHDTPASMSLGLHYGRVIGEHYKSHFYTNFGLDYAWLFHRKRGEDVGTFHGISPLFEFGKSFKIGKESFSAYQFTSHFTAPKFDPSFKSKFIDVFAGYRYLHLNSNEAKGHTLIIGIRYKLNKYSIRKNLERMKKEYDQTKQLKTI